MRIADRDKRPIGYACQLYRHMYVNAQTPSPLPVSVFPEYLAASAYRGANGLSLIKHQAACSLHNIPTNTTQYMCITCIIVQLKTPTVYRTFGEVLHDQAH